MEDGIIPKLSGIDFSIESGSDQAFSSAFKNRDGQNRLCPLSWLGFDLQVSPE